MSSNGVDPAGQGVGVWVRWMASARDGQVHTFPLAGPGAVPPVLLVPPRPEHPGATQ